MIRSLVVAYDASSGGRVALQHAVDVAGRCDGRVVILTVGATGESDADLLRPEGVDPVALAEAPRGEDEEVPVASESDAALSEAVELCRELTVRCLARPAYGDVASALVRASALSDLAFIGRDALPAASSPLGSARSARAVAARAHCPVVVTPRQYAPVRSVLGLCPTKAQAGGVLRTACELASLLQVKAEALMVAEEPNIGGRWARDIKRYLVDHGHTAQVIVRKPPATEQLVGVVGERQSPLVVVPRSSRWASMVRRDYLSAAMQILSATIVVVP